MSLQGQETLAATVLHAAQRSDVPMLVTGKMNTY